MPMRIVAVAAIAFFTLLAGCQNRDESTSATPAAPQPVEGSVVAMGDSLTAGLGLPEKDAYPAQLERKLRQAGYRWRVVNAGISGETSSGALSRVDWVLKLKPDVVILETGANDGLRGIDPAVTRGNIDRIAGRLQKSGVVVVLAGMQMVKNLGEPYLSRFMSIYPAVAKRHHLILIPFFLANVAGIPALNQPDGIHPLAQGYRIVTDTVYPYVIQAIELKRKTGQGASRQ